MIFVMTSLCGEGVVLRGEISVNDLGDDWFVW